MAKTQRRKNISRKRMGGSPYYNSSTKTYFREYASAFSEFPYDIPKETESLILTSVRFTTIPDSIGKLTNLKKLRLSMYEIKYLSPEIQKLPKLEEFSISESIIEEFPDIVLKLTKLKRLDMANNKITKIPNEIDQLINLEELNVSGNYLITKIPDTIGNLTKLKTLKVHYNILTEIPDTIGNLTNLETLYLNNNKITKIPDIIGNLTKLKILNLGYNKLKYLPDTIGNLTELKSIYVQVNELVTLPQSMAKLNNLSDYVDFSKNPYKYIPENVQKNLAKHLTFLPKPFPTDDWVSVFNAHQMYKKTDRPFHKMLNNDVSSHIFSFLEPQQQEEILKSQGVDGGKRKTRKTHKRKS